MRGKAHGPIIESPQHARSDPVRPAGPGTPAPAMSFAAARLAGPLAQGNGPGQGARAAGQGNGATRRGPGVLGLRTPPGSGAHARTPRDSLRKPGLLTRLPDEGH